MKKDFNYQIGDIVQVAQVDRPQVAGAKDSGKDRIANFAGQIIKLRGEGPSKTFTVRAVLEGITVDRIFPIASPFVKSIKLVEKPKKTPRRARLFKQSAK